MPFIGEYCQRLGFEYWSFYTAARSEALPVRYQSNLPPLWHQWARSNLGGIFGPLRRLSHVAYTPIRWDRAQLERCVQLPALEVIPASIDGVSLILSEDDSLFSVFTVMRFERALPLHDLHGMAGQLAWLGGLLHGHVLRPIVDEGVEPLTLRQREVMGLVVEGLTAQQIAEQLNLSRRTVRFHQEAVMRRLGATNITAAAFQVGRLGLL
ncbi:LuxR C-terminal-related transcriptional regulator [Pseudomonas sp. NPDC007930]|uniref:helix-turn-helix transcriptional regulator n=1 Tax=Pseudomonas sp. NPDC007930 TaxID=3364417 RepID=UPI0036E39CCB